jgi:hypothetical protein
MFLGSSDGFRPLNRNCLKKEIKKYVELFLKQKSQRAGTFFGKVPVYFHLKKIWIRIQNWIWPKLTDSNRAISLIPTGSGSLAYLAERFNWPDVIHDVDKCG